MNLHLELSLGGSLEQVLCMHNFEPDADADRAQALPELCLEFAPPSSAMRYDHSRLTAAIARGDIQRS